MFSMWTYFFCAVGLCSATMGQESKEELRASIQQKAVNQDSKVRSGKHNVRHTLGALDLKVDGLVIDIKDLKELTKDKFESLVCPVNPSASEHKPRNTRKVRNRRELEVNGVHTMANLFLALYDKAVSTSLDVKTLLEKTDEIIENTNNCTCSSDAPEQADHRPRSCLELRKKGHTMSGVYVIYVAGLGKLIEVYCDQDTEGGGWIVFQRRKDGSVDFYRNWKDYKAGFGDLEGEFWLGLDKLHHLTASVRNDLRIDLQDLQNNKKYAKYSEFIVGSEGSGYRLTSDGYTGSAGDSFGKGSGSHNGHRFSTKDVDNDDYSTSCADLYKGGWWYDGCHRSNLNGLYLKGDHKSYADGIEWYHWKGFHYSLTFTEMKIREQI